MQQKQICQDLLGSKQCSLRLYSCIKKLNKGDIEWKEKVRRRKEEKIENRKWRKKIMPNYFSRQCRKLSKNQSDKFKRKMCLKTSSSCRCFLADSISSSNSCCRSSSVFCRSSRRRRTSVSSAFSAATWWLWEISCCLQCSSHERFTVTSYNNRSINQTASALVTCHHLPTVRDLQLLAVLVPWLIHSHQLRQTGKKT